ncbi:MAG: DUF1700 domain-containing protein, partial [Lachnospiraceae bacterium]|nr:DUF1700 domain-containing protein [Lachnospiraceae bacterium]
MNKPEFLARLREGLKGLPDDDVEERINFYSEMIDDRIEEGVDEDTAIREIGSADEIAQQVIADTSLTKIVKERITPKRKMKGGEIALLILGAPLWIPLIIAASAVLFSLFISLWAVIISLWAVDLALLVAGLFAILLGILQLVRGNALSPRIAHIFSGDAASGIALIGIGLVSIGLSIFLFYGCLAASKGAAKLVRKTVTGLKKLFLRR